MSLTLYTYAGDFRKFKALIAAQYNGVTIEQPSFTMGTDNKTKEFLAKSPMGRVPLLETEDGCIFESNAIARYVARLRRDTELYGSSYFDSGCVDAWLDFCSIDIELPSSLWILPILGYKPFDAEVFKTAKGDLIKGLMTLEKHLTYRTFLVGEKVTLADIAIVSALVYPMKMVLDGGIRSRMPNVVRWFLTCVNQPEFAAVIGQDVPLCAKALQAAGAKGAKGKGKKKGGAGESKSDSAKAGKKKAAQPPNPPKKKPAKKKGPFDGLPKSKLNGDAWKRIYANNDADYTKAMPQFWELMDEGWSLWRSAYKYNDENKVGFMTKNGVTGFMQRSTEIQRNLFGVLKIIQRDERYCVDGVFLIRGQSIQPLLDCNPDAEYHAWSKLDVANEDDRKLVEGVWTVECEKELLGGTVYDYMVFL